MSKRLTNAEVLKRFLKKHRAYTEFCREVVTTYPRQQGYTVDAFSITDCLHWNSTHKGWGYYNKLNDEFKELFFHFNLTSDDTTISNVTAEYRRKHH